MHMNWGTRRHDETNRRFLFSKRPHKYITRNFTQEMMQIRNVPPLLTAALLTMDSLAVRWISVLAICGIYLLSWRLQLCILPAPYRTLCVSALTTYIAYQTGKSLPACSIQKWIFKCHFLSFLPSSSSPQTRLFLTWFPSLPVLYSYFSFWYPFFRFSAPIAFPVASYFATSFPPTSFNFTT
jgi:hypothetical protein